MESSYLYLGPIQITRSDKDGAGLVVLRQVGCICFHRRKIAKIRIESDDVLESVLVLLIENRHSR